VVRAKKGDVVKVHYTGRRADRSVFDTSRGGSPIELTLGERAVIEGLEEAVVGLTLGATRTQCVPPEKAFGERREERVVQMKRDDLPDWLDPEPGQILRAREPMGRIRLVTIKDVAGENVTVDANHPLAGEDVTIEVELVEIV